jgi:hypothetical protein
MEDLLIPSANYEPMSKLARLSTTIDGFFFINRSRTQLLESRRLQVILKTFYLFAVQFIPGFIALYRQSRVMTRAMQRVFESALAVNSVETFRRGDQTPLELLLKAHAHTISDMMGMYDFEVYWHDENRNDLPNDLLNLIWNCIRIMKFVEHCLPRDVVNDPTIETFPDLSEAYFKDVFEYCYMYGDLEKFEVIYCF